MAGGCGVGQHEYRTFLSPQKALLGNDGKASISTLQLLKRNLLMFSLNSSCNVDSCFVLFVFFNLERLNGVPQSLCSSSFLSILPVRSSNPFCSLGIKYLDHCHFLSCLLRAVVTLASLIRRRELVISSGWILPPHPTASYSLNLSVPRLRNGNSSRCCCED